LPKHRDQLSAGEVAQLRDDLARRLEAVGVQSQPQVALKILDLIRNPDSQLKEYSAIVRNDPALSGRLLKIANSAFFAQRKPVTNLDRACLLLGVERLKVMSLGFHLSRAATTDPSATLSRVVWGQSIFRACLAAEVARRTAPGLAAEAFIIGLLMDAGLALMPRLAGSAFQALWDSNPSPARLHRAEIAQLPFGHTDVSAALAIGWKLPDLLRFPISEHHAPPALPARSEPMHRLHAIAYTVGMIDLCQDTQGRVAVEQDNPSTHRAIERVLCLPADAVRGIIAKAATEYDVTKDVFKDVATSLPVDDALLERINVGIVEAIDGLVMATIDQREVSANTTCRFRLGGQSIEFHRANDGSMAAYLYDSRGQRLLTHVFNPKGQTSLSIRDALALDPHPDDELDAIDRHFRAA
jgi:HD-like signal output (HDOD) protein